MTKRLIIILSLLTGSISQANIPKSGDINLAFRPPTVCPYRAAVEKDAISNEKQNTHSGKNLIMQADAKDVIRSSPARRGSK